MVVDDRFGAVAPADVGVHRVALDGSGPNQRHLDDQVVEHPRLQAWQRGHLRTRLHLEDADGIGTLQHLVHRGFGEVELCEVDVDALVLGNQIDAVVQGGQHAEAKQVELDQTNCRAVVLVPLQHTSVFHPRPLHRTHVGDRPVADHHAA
jgi:hypothetical protein